MKIEDVPKIYYSIHLVYGGVLLSLLILLLSAIHSAETGNWTWFSRSGSLLVVIGVLLAAYDVKNRMVQINSNNPIIKHSFIIELGILVVGTLVWGYGDLISFNPNA